MQAITTVGLDIAKSVFQVHGVDAIRAPGAQATSVPGTTRTFKARGGSSALDRQADLVKLALEVSTVPLADMVRGLCNGQTARHAHSGNPALRRLLM
jgi:hypothetical protein